MPPQHTCPPPAGNRALVPALSRLAAAGLLLILLAPAALPQTDGAESPQPPQALGQERDYFLPDELPPGAGGVQVLEAEAVTDFSGGADAVVGAASFPTESIIQYQSFNGLTYTLHAYTGKYVMWALPDTAIGGTTGLSPEEIRKLVSLSDLHYARAADLFNGEPGPAGFLLTIALVDTGSVAGVGRVGQKGAEVSPTHLGRIKEFLARELLSEVVTHELMHNFDIYGGPTPYIAYYGDFPHAWTAFGIGYMQTYERSGFSDLTPETALSLNTANLVGPWDAAGASASWAGCVRNGGGCAGLGITANNAWGGFVMRYAKLHGPAVMKKAFEYLKNYKAQNPAAPATPEGKNDLLVRALAYGVGANVSCEVDAWRWTLSSTLRTNLAALYPAQNAFCVDADGDGYTRARGDFNDANAAVSPAAQETANGVDDNCNDLVDDLLVAEPAGGDFPSPQPVGFPGRITGTTSSSGDVDSFTLDVPAPRKFLFKFCSTLDFDGFLLMKKPGGILFDFQPVSAGQCLSQIMDFDVAGQYGFDVQPNTHAGAYTAQYRGLKPWPAPWGTTAAPALVGGAYRLSATTQTLAGAFRTPTQIKFWVEGFGFVGTVPYAATATFDWTPPPGTPSGTYAYRAQPFASTVPVEAVTLPQSFNVTRLTISGRVLIGTVGLDGVALQLKNAGGQVLQTATTATVGGVKGSYAFTGVAPGASYTVVPAPSAVFTFTPPSRAYTNITTDQTGQNFTAARKTYSISGRVIISTVGLNGIPVQLRNSGGAVVATATTATTAAGAGSYSFPAVQAGLNYTVAPAASAVFAYAPASRSYTNLAANQAAQDFSAARKTYTISGRITISTVGLNGLVVQLKNSSGTVIRTATTATPVGGLAGTYSFAGVPAGLGYFVSPAPSAVFTYAPASSTVASLTSNLSLSFAAARKTYTISGRVLQAGSATAGVGGVTMTLFNAATNAVVKTGLTATDGTGGYSLTGVPAGISYTLKPSKTGLTFTPVSKSYAALSANQANQNFASP